MSDQGTDHLYGLLPAVYRMRDANQDEQLRALLAVVEKEYSALDKNISDLYENWFIETCEEWVIPYIADLLGVRGLHAVESTGIYSLRAFVANILAFRRRKGTATMLEELVRDVTDWPSRVVEFFQLLAITQNLNHLQLNVRTVDLRQSSQLELLGGPFERTAHTVDVHGMSGGGKYNIPNIGLYAWRLQSYPMKRGTARAVGGPAGRYRFNPLGLDAPLFNEARPERARTQIAEAVNVPGALPRRALYEELEGRRPALVDKMEPETVYFGENPVLRVFVKDTSQSQFSEILPEEIMICDLSDPLLPIADGWRRCPTEVRYRSKETGTPEPRTIRVAVDPELGRLAFPTGISPAKVEVSYSYGFSGDIGGGPYDRGATVSSALIRPASWWAAVSTDNVEDESKRLYSSLAKAVKKWNDKVKQEPNTAGVIVITDNHTYDDKLDPLAIPKGSQLLVVAADSHKGTARDFSQFSRTDLRPHLLGDISIVVSEPGSISGDATIDGLLIDGKLTTLANGPGSLRLVQSTLVPSKGGLSINSSVQPAKGGLQVTIERAITGPLSITGEVQRLEITDSILDNAGATAITAPEIDAKIATSTIFGEVSLRSLEAENSIFTNRINVARKQIGCIRFCFVPMGSRTPRRYRCQPDLALKDVWDPRKKTSVLADLKPIYTSVIYGNPRYAQLSRSCPKEIRTGAEDESEIGAFSFLKQPQREANFRSQLVDFMPFGLEAALIPVT